MRIGRIFAHSCSGVRGHEETAILLGVRDFDLNGRSQVIIVWPYHPNQPVAHEVAKRRELL